MIRHQMTTDIFNRLSKEQLEAILDALPLEFIFVDHEDKLQYYNKAAKRSRQGRKAFIGNDIRDCHQPSSHEFCIGSLLALRFRPTGAGWGGQEEIGPISGKG